MKFHDIGSEYTYRTAMLRYHEGFLNGIRLVSYGTDDNAALIASAQELYDRALADFNDVYARFMALASQVTP
jgi:hypothetical protein